MINMEEGNIGGVAGESHSGGADGKDSGIIRRQPETAQERRALVSRWQGDVEHAEKHWQKAFARMREDMDFVSGKQWSEAEERDGCYKANITQRHVQQRVAALYAKNPKMVCKRRRKLDSAIWDGTVAQVQTAAQNPLDPMNQAVLAEFSQAMIKRKLYDRMAETMELVADYQWREQDPPLKVQMKQLVRRTVITGIGYVKPSYRRLMELKPEDAEKVGQVAEQMANMERILANMEDGQCGEHEAEMEQLRLQMLNLQRDENKIVKQEGLLFDFPQSHHIIADPKTKQLKGFLGADWVAQKYLISTRQVEELFGVDLKKAGGQGVSGYTQYSSETMLPVSDSEQSSGGAGENREPLACVYEIYCKRDGLVYYIAQGYADFLKEPASPDVKLERFWPWFAITFNEIDDERDIYPSSDVALMRPMQKEYNRAREGLREHRRANRPKLAIGKSTLDDSDMQVLKCHPANAVIQINALQPGQRINDLIQPIMGSPIMPELYDTNFLFEDIMRVVGSQEANLGGTSGSTATESAIAEGSRMSALQSSVDDLDDLLNELSRACGQILLMHMDKATVQKIAGPGAVWPDSPETAQDAAQELDLQIEAGSSGRPNKAAEIANFERLLPYLLQMPGVNAEWLFKQSVRRLDEGIELADAFQADLPSIIAQNAMKGAVNGANGGAGVVAKGSGNVNGNQSGNGGATAPEGNSGVGAILPDAQNGSVARTGL